MSVTWIAVCDKKRETIDPGKIGEGANQEHFVYYAASNVIAHAMLNGWLGGDVTLERDSDHEAMERILDYKDVTEEAVRAYNAWRPVHLAAVEFNARG